MSSDPIQNLDKIIHEKRRMAIMSLLAVTPDLSFTEMRDTLGMTDGNLSVHIRTLQEAGYVAVTKAFKDRKPFTTCKLTPTGEKAFGDYIDGLEVIVKRAKGRTLE